MNSNPAIKRILCYGDSLTFGKVPGLTKRYPANERWTGILQSLLGDQFEIIEEGLRARTTNLNDPTAVGRNGLEYFRSCILSHLPINLVILMLGTNDLKERFGRNASDVAMAFREYKNAITFACDYLEETEPKIFLVAPPVINEAHIPLEWGYKGGEEKSKLLGSEYNKIAQEIQVDFLDLAHLISPSPIDGIHLDKENNQKIAALLAEKITEICKEQ